MEYLVHVETVISPVLSVVFVFSGAFSQPGFHFFPADKIDEPVGRLWERNGGLQVIQAGPADRVLEGSSGCRRQSCGDSWVEMDSLDKPQNP